VWACHGINSWMKRIMRKDEEHKGKRMGEEDVEEEE
jgi:hypothetical protein